MAKYNPNSIWKSPKREEDVYTRPAASEPTQAKPASKPQPTVTRGAASTSASTSAGNATAAGTATSEPYFKKTPIEHFDEPHHKKSNVAWWSLGIFVVLLGGGAGYFFLRPAPGPNVSIGFTPPASQALVGDPFELQVNLSNSSAVILNNAMLALTLPANISFVGQDASQRVMQTQVGDIGPGSVNDQSFNLIVTGDPNTVKQITASLAYGTASSKAQLETQQTDNLVVGSPAITLAFNAPPTVFSGQNFQIPITYTNNTSHSFQNVVLSLVYPQDGFVFGGSTMQPADPANDTWNLGTIPAAGNGMITITGNVAGSGNNSYVLTGNLTGSVSGDTYTLSNASATLALGASPLSLAVSVNNDPNYVSKTGDTLNYTISYTNNSDVTFQNATVSAVLTGAMYDFSTIQSGGTFSSLTNAITWNAANTPALLNIAAGASGSVTFTVRTKTAYPIRFLSDKNFTLGVNARISSATVPPGTAASSTLSIASSSNKVGGAISFTSEALYHDTSGFANSGPFPPKVNKATEYSIHWIITNYATDAENVTVSGYLQSGTTCTGTSTIKSNMPTVPTCNPANGLLTWTIPNVPATTGVTGPPAEAVIQVMNTPASNQVGNTVTLLGPTTLAGTDGFTSSTLQATAQAVTTQLVNDPVYGSSNGQVTQ